MSGLIERVREKLSGLATTVTTTPALGDIDQLQMRLPALVVAREGESAGPSRLVGAVDQKVTHRVAIVLVLGPGGSPAGRDDALEALRVAVIEALVGWRPDTGYEPMLLSAGRFAGAGGGRIAYALTFTTSSHIRKV